MICEENPDIPLGFIKGTLEAKAEVEAGFGDKYGFGVIE